MRPVNSRHLPAGVAGAARDDPRVLMLGMGWFPQSTSGLDRYYRCLFEQLPGSAGIVIGPAADAPAPVQAVASEDSTLPRRLYQFWTAARHASSDCDVVDAHFALYAAAPLLLGAARRRPLVFHFHGPWADESLAAGDASRVRLTLRRALERWVLHQAQAHVVLSSAFRRVLVERYGVSPWGIDVLGPAVALDTFTPGERSQARERLGLDACAFVAVCARRLVARMGIDGLFDAWGLLQSELPAGSTLLLVGDGPLGDDLAARAARPPLAGTVRLMGRVCDAELIDAYRAADVAVVPSVAVEGLGLVVLEAAACGTPSVVSDVGGLPEITAPLDPSLIVAHADRQALGARLRSAAQGSLPTRTATRAYAEGFGWPEVAERHRKLYRGLLNAGPDKRVRVVYLDHIARLSGGEIAMLHLLPHLERVNAHVILAEEGPLVGKLQQAGISVEVLPISGKVRDLRKDTVLTGRPQPVALFQTLAYVARLAWRLGRLQPDLVHANSLKAGVYGSLAARLTQTPFVWHVRDRITEDYLPAPAVALIRRLVPKLADGLIAYSDTTLETLHVNGRPAVRSVLPDSVQVPDDRLASRSERTRSACTFGMVGRIAPWKGQDVFLRAFAAASSGQGEQAVIVGSPLFGEEGYELQLRNLVGDLGLEDRVEFRGFREDVWAELASFDVLVHASVIAEPFGQVVLEGMAAGLPVIASAGDGPATLIDDGQTGRLVASGDVDALARTMKVLARDPQGRKRLGLAARRAVEEYRPTAIAARMQQFYEQVLEGAHAGAARSGN